MNKIFYNLFNNINLKIEMAFRTTAFQPIDKQMLVNNDASIDFAGMQKKLAQEMARMKIVDEKKKREIEKIVMESDELKEL